MVEPETKDQGCFLSYPSIQNDYHKEGENMIANLVKNEKTLWITTEKIHGTNFSFICDGKTVIHASRNQLLKDKDSFNNFQEISKKYKNATEEIFKRLKENHLPSLKLLRVFGELYGGTYPNLPKKFKAIQKEVLYTPELEFELFDLWIEYADEKNQEVKTFYDYKKAIALAEEFKIPYAKILFEGNLEQTLEYVENLGIRKNKFQSTIYLKFGLPEPGVPNIAEGVVIKTNEPEVIDGELTRPSLKIKSPMHLETEPKVEKKKPEEKGDAAAKKKSAFSQFATDLAEKYITLNRFNNLVKKFNDDERNLKTLKKPLITDALNDLNKEEPEDVIKKANTSEKGQLMGAMSKICDEMIPNALKELE